MENSEIKFDRDVDARFVACPIPILRTKKVFAGMKKGETMRVTTTDPGSVIDFAEYARITGSDLLSSTDREVMVKGKAVKEFEFIIRRNKE